MATTTLYKRNDYGISIWRITSRPGVLVMEWGAQDGIHQEQVEYVEENESGRSLEEQTELRRASRISKKLDKGYVRDPASAKGSGLNQLGFPRPMLAKPYGKVKNLRLDNAYVQYKYDGHRCLIVNDSTHGMMAYSRNGKPITTISHILSSFVDLPVGVILDGELYVHGTSLQRITSYAKRRQAGTSLLTYMLYDAMLPETFYERLVWLHSLTIKPNGAVQIAPTVPVESGSEFIWDGLRAAKSLGYEGLIIRPRGYEYQDGKRSSGLIKVKSREDGEFEVKDVISSKDGAGILRCVTANGKQFYVTAPGAVARKAYILRYKKAFIGRFVTVEYANWTDDGKPFHPIATRFRGDL